MTPISGQRSKEETAPVAPGARRLVVVAKLLQVINKITLGVSGVLLVVVLFSLSYYPTVEERVAPYLKATGMTLVVGVVLSEVLHHTSTAVRTNVPRSFVDHVFDETYDRKNDSKRPMSLLAEKMRDSGMGLILTVICLVGLFLFEQFGIDHKPRAFRACEQFVKEHLRDPGSAKFAGYTDAAVSGQHPVYVVRSEVDSQNGFGATTFVCEVRRRDTRFRLVRLEFAP